MFNFIKNPRITNRSSTNHHSITSIFFVCIQSFFSGESMSPFPKIRNFNIRILFDFRNIFPICFTFVHLRTVLRESSINALIPASCNLNATSSILIVSTSQPNLVFTVTGRCVEFTTAFVNRTIKSTSFKTPAPAPLKLLFHGTTEINVHNIRIYGFYNFGRKNIASSSPPKI